MQAHRKFVIKAEPADTAAFAFSIVLETSILAEVNVGAYVISSVVCSENILPRHTLCVWIVGEMHGCCTVGLRSVWRLATPTRQACESCTSDRQFASNLILDTSLVHVRLRMRKWYEIPSPSGTQLLGYFAAFMILVLGILWGLQHTKVQVFRAAVGSAEPALVRAERKRRQLPCAAFGRIVVIPAVAGNWSKASLADT